MSTLTERMREQVRQASGVCPACHQPTTEGGVRALGDRIGIGYSTLWRWLRGADISGRNLDKIDAWLNGDRP